MLYDMAMISGFLADFQLKPELGEDNIQIRSITLGEASDDPTVLSIFMQGEDVICSNGGNKIRVLGGQIEEVVNAVVRHMDHYNSWERRALNAVATGKPLSQYLSLLSELFPGYTVKFLDALGRIHYSTDPSEVLPKAMDPIYMTLIRNIPACHRISQGISGVTVFWSSYFKRHYLYGNFIFPDNSFIIFSVFPEDEDSKPLGDLQLHLGRFAQSIFQCANVSRLDHAGLTMNRNFIMRMLDGQEVSDQDLLDLEKLLGWPVSDGAYLVRIENHPKDGFAARALPYTLSARLPFSFAFNYKDAILCLISQNDFKYGCRVLQDMLSPIGFNGGVSLPFTSWQEVPNAYLQARISLEHKDRSSAQLLMCSDFLWDCYVERFSSQGCERLRHPAIDALLQSPGGGEQLLDTLYWYLRNNCSLAAAADKLGIHINTMKYRMNKVRDMIHFDPMDYESRMAFLVSYDVMHMKELPDPA